MRPLTSLALLISKKDSERLTPMPKTYKVIVDGNETCASEAKAKKDVWDKVQIVSSIVLSIAVATIAYLTFSSDERYKEINETQQRVTAELELENTIHQYLRPIFAIDGTHTCNQINKELSAFELFLNNIVAKSKMALNMTPSLKEEKSFFDAIALYFDDEQKALVAKESKRKFEHLITEIELQILSYKTNADRFAKHFPCPIAKSKGHGEIRFTDETQLLDDTGEIDFPVGLSIYIDKAEEKNTTYNLFLSKPSESGSALIELAPIGKKASISLKLPASFCNSPSQEEGKNAQMAILDSTDRPKQHQCKPLDDGFYTFNATSTDKFLLVCQSDCIEIQDNETDQGSSPDTPPGQGSSEPSQKIESQSLTSLSAEKSYDALTSVLQKSEQSEVKNDQIITRPNTPSSSKITRRGWVYLGRFKRDGWETTDIHKRNVKFGNDDLDSPTRYTELEENIIDATFTVNASETDNASYILNVRDDKPSILGSLGQVIDQLQQNETGLVKEVYKTFSGHIWAQIEYTN